jgi:cysteine synthase A
MKIYKDVSETIGKTPTVKISSRTLSSDTNVVLLAKLEYFNPCSSIKDRIAKNMIEQGELDGKLKPGGLIIEPTSGNTGLGLAMVAAAKGYRLIITMPETMSLERRLLLQFLGATVVLTPAEKGMNGALERAEELLKENPQAFMPQQFVNPANPDIHRKTTAEEIWNDTDGRIDIFVTGVGTGGTITGVGEFLKKRKPEIKIVAVEPAGSAVLSGEAPGRHGIQGIGVGFVPEILNRSVIDEIVKVNDDDAFESSKKLARNDGILCGISSGAALFAAIEIAKRRENDGKMILVMIMDSCERYLSTRLFP